MEFDPARLSVSDWVWSGSYDAAARTRRTSGWRSSTADATAEWEGAGATLRNRVRELHRNNPWAHRATTVLANNIIGIGIRGKVQGRTPGGGRRTRAMRVDEAWQEWAADPRQCDYHGRTNFGGLQRLVLKTLVLSGECLIRRYWSEGNEHCPLRLRVMEPDYIADQQVPDGLHRRLGIDFHSSGPEAGRPRAYNLFIEHPGDSSLAAVSREVEKVPAEEIIHVFADDRPGQLRGVPWLVTSALAMRDLHDGTDAERVKRKIAALYAGFITRPPGISGPTAVATQSLPPLEPGLMRVLLNGEDVRFSDPPRVDGFGEFTKVMLREIAAGLNVTYESLSGDLESVNFSSARMGWLEFQRSLAAWRETLIMPQLLVPVWRWWRLGIQPRLGAIGNISMLWTPPRREMIDPTREVPALERSVQLGLMSLPEAIRAEGRDPDRILEEAAEFGEKAQRAKVRVTGDVLERDDNRAATN